MKRNNEEPLKTVIQRMLKAYGLEEGYYKTLLINCWPQVMGKMIGVKTTGLSIRKKVLYVKMSSAPLKQELSYGKQKIVKMLNDHVGEQVIIDVVFQ
jgi:predicted nucleic acid-binding Zn ribbon protein